MEFEKDVPATDAQIALANTPKITLMPAGSDIQPEAVNSNYTHQNEATFAFETESTDASVVSKDSMTSNHHVIAIMIAAGCTLFFAAVLAAALLLR